MAAVGAAVSSGAGVLYEKGKVVAEKTVETGKAAAVPVFFFAVASLNRKKITS